MSSILNEQLAAVGVDFRLAYAEYVSAAESELAGGKLIFFKDVGNKQLDAHWVPGDPRGQGTTDVLYVTDSVDGLANCGDSCLLDAVSTTAAIERGMAAWDAISCASLPIVNLGALPEDLGIAQFFGPTGGGAPFFFPGVITHGGWLPADFFESLLEGGGEGILGVTLTFTWIDRNGNPTDINRDGKADVAFREIYMNDGFAWEIGNRQGTDVFDIEVVMFHEQGHALSQAHFGEISLNAPRNNVIISPKGGDNLMLAAIGSNQQWTGFHGTDTGGHCSIWGNWPLR